ncbi:MAG: hypothetical protein JWR37_5477 [Mycobacterium sp.]|nr:hypothetical protein [Mycobacterium sp.]
MLRGWTAHVKPRRRRADCLPWVSPRRRKRSSPRKGIGLTLLPILVLFDVPIIKRGDKRDNTNRWTAATAAETGRRVCDHGIECALRASSS